MLSTTGTRYSSTSISPHIFNSAGIWYTAGSVGYHTAALNRESTTLHPDRDGGDAPRHRTASAPEAWVSESGVR